LKKEVDDTKNLLKKEKNKNKSMAEENEKLTQKMKKM